MRKVSLTEHKSDLVKAFLGAGVNAVNAQIAAQVLYEADLRNIKSHGVARLKGYLRLIESGRIQPNQTISIEKERLSTLNVNANQGLGLVAGHEVMELCIQKAKKTGICFATIYNSSHFGIAQAHSNLAIHHGCIGFAMTNASPLVSPSGSTEAFFGTNPICYSIPVGGEYAPIIIDLATSAVSNGKLELKAKANLEMPTGWAIDSLGNPTTDPLILSKGGTLVPLGSDEAHSYHKGYGLGALVDILSGVLSGANFGRWVPPFVSFLDVKESVGQGIGHVIGAIDIEAFMDLSDFQSRLQTWIQGIKQLSLVEGVEEMLIPGEPEFRAIKENLDRGYLEVD